MKKNDKHAGLHPLLQIGPTVERQGLVVLDNIINMPFTGDEYISPFAVIALCQQGTLDAEYGMKSVVFRPHDLSIMRAGHVIKTKTISADYRTRLIVMSDEFLEKFRQRNISHFDAHILYYITHPSCHLSDEQYHQMEEAFNLLKTVSNIGQFCREEMMLNVFHTIIMMRYEFCPIPNDAVRDERSNLSTHFNEAIVKHYRKSHKVDFYARLFNLSPKYFSTLIKSEIGLSASECIDRYLTLQAKILLNERRDLAIQQIADLLGFSEQASFSRFFKKRSGLSPSEFRDFTNQSSD